MLFHLFIAVVSAQQVNNHVLIQLDSSNLPIIRIDTYGKTIPDEPKIKSYMSIIDNGYNKVNTISDKNYTYSGNIGIEMRGSISQSPIYPQKSYNIETQDSLGNDKSAVILGMPSESDWVLYGPYSDHSFMRNVVSYKLSSQLGYWSPKTQFCEVVYKAWGTWNYSGLYVMMEKIKRDKNRVDIAKLDPDDNAGDSLTGGYIIAVDRNINKADSGWFSSHLQNTNVYYTYKYPKGEDITPEQKNYIQTYIKTFENIMSSPDFADTITGYRKYIDVKSFIDFFFLQEISKNIDAFKRSAWMYKDKDSKGGKLIASPHWDYNSAYGIQLCGFDNPAGWTYPMTCWVNQSFPVPFWWEKLLEDQSYKNEIKCRWNQLRGTVLSNANIYHIIDSISSYINSAATREYSQYNINDNLQNATSTLKNWFTNRLKWLDENMPGTCNDSYINIFPNPTNGDFVIGGVNNPAMITVYDNIGRIIFSKYNYVSSQQVNLSGTASGIYLINITNGAKTYNAKVIYVNK